MAEKATDAGAAPVKEAAAPVAPAIVEAQAPTEIVYLDMKTREIVREYGNTVSRYSPGKTEFDLYAEMNTYEKRNGGKSGA